MTYVSDIAARIREAVDADALPDGETKLLFLFYAVLLLSKGEMVTSEDVHNAWAAWMTYEDDTHEAIIEFTSLPEETRGEDRPFAEAIRQVAAQIKQDQSSER